MKYYVEQSLANFKFWEGGKDRADNLTCEELEKLDGLLPQVFGEEPPSDNEINDLFWFDFKTVCSLLGYGCDDRDDPVRPD